MVYALQRRHHIKYNTYTPTPIPTCRSHSPVPLSTTCRVYTYPHPQHRIDSGVLRTATTQPLTGEGFKMKFTTWEKLLGPGSGSIHIMRETPRVQLRLDQLSAFSAHNSVGPPQWMTPDPQQALHSRSTWGWYGLFIGEEVNPGSHIISSCKYRLGGGVDFHSLYQQMVGHTTILLTTVCSIRSRFNGLCCLTLVDLCVSECIHLPSLFHYSSPYSTLSAILEWELI